MAAIPCPICETSGAQTFWREAEWELVRCPSCGLAFVGNPPDAERLRALYSKDAGFHAELSSEDPRADAAADRTAADHLGLMASRQRPGTLLDVGCAAGHFLAAAAAAGWKARGVELNDDTAAIARSHGHDVATGTLEDLVAAEGDAVIGGFDAVTLWDVIEHVPDPLGLLREARELLAPDGLMWLATPNIDGIFPRASLKVAARVGAWPHPEPPYHLSQFSHRTLGEALGRAGLAEVLVEHRRIPLSYTFGSPRTVVSDPKRLAYTAVFAPLAAAGPWVHSGDTLVVAARRV